MTTNSDWPVKTKKISLLALWFACSGLAAAGQVNIRTEAGKDLPLMSAGALASAIEKGQTIRGYRVSGRAIEDVLLRRRQELACKSRAALILESSIIEGPVTIGGASVARGNGSDNSADVGEEDSNGDSERRDVRFPVSIRDTTVTGDMQLDGLNFRCRLDLSKTRLEGQFRALDSEFHEMVADGATFEREVLLRNVRWLGPASFRATEFRQNAEFVNFGQHWAVPASFADVDFEEAVFRRIANFVEVHFDGATSFRAMLIKPCKRD